MTPHEIEPEDVRVGDRARMTMEVTFYASPYGGHPVTNIGGVVLDARVVCDAFGPLTLIDRPLPPIPTDERTIIRHKQTGVIYVRTFDDGRWAKWGMDGKDADWTPTREDYDVLVPEVLP